MIGIGTIGRAAESGGSTTDQNGKYIAISSGNGFMLYSSDFGQTFVKKACPRGAVLSILCISSTGEVLARVYQNEIYYLSDINSNWTTISNPSGSNIEMLGASYDFSVIVVMPTSKRGDAEYYYSNNKGISFTRYGYSSSVWNQVIYTGKLSGDGKIAFLSVYSSDSSEKNIVELDISSHSTSTTILGTNYKSSYSNIFVSYTGAIKGWYMYYNSAYTYTIYGKGSYSGVQKIDSEDEVNIYYYNTSNYNMYKIPSTILFNTGNISNGEIYTVTNGSNQVFYTVNATNFKAYSSTGTLLYTTTYPNNESYIGIAAISRVIPQ